MNPGEFNVTTCGCLPFPQHWGFHHQFGAPPHTPNVLSLTLCSVFLRQKMNSVNVWAVGVGFWIWRLAFPRDETRSWNVQYHGAWPWLKVQTSEHNFYMQWVLFEILVVFRKKEVFAKLQIFYMFSALWGGSHRAPSFGAEHNLFVNFFL